MTSAEKPLLGETLLPDKSYMTRGTYQRLIEEIDKRREAVRRILRESGEASEGSDKWHDEHVKNLVGEELAARRRLWEAGRAQNSAEIINQPSQVGKVVLGHRVLVRFLYGEGGGEEGYVTLLGESDVMWKDPSFDQSTETVVSHKSPLGSALLGVQQGQEVVYGARGKMFRVLILGIGISPLVGEEESKTTE